MRTLISKRVVLATIMSLAGFLQGGLDRASVQAAVKGQEVLMAEVHPPREIGGSYPNLSNNDGEGAEEKVRGERLFQRNLQSGVLQQSGNGARLQLKSPGKLPGIELGVEMHSLQAFQSVIPSENLPQGLDVKQKQPILLRPSINAPDYNGGFLRFTW
ncbi:MAG TPA: hypothetical protein PKM72_02705 [Nitrospirales bacterium]|nr:hypothetical protein [Nitrospira sp. MA-1]HNP59720.1 hypothetical protein [Nitrospirales bacterium]